MFVFITHVIRPRLTDVGSNLIIKFWQHHCSVRTPIKSTQRVASFQDTQKIIHNGILHCTVFVATSHRGRSSEKTVQCDMKFRGGVPSASEAEKMNKSL